MKQMLRRYAPWVLLALIAAAVVVYTQRTKAVVVDIVVAQAKDVQTSVVASGRVLAPARVDVGATITGRVEQVAVREGARHALERVRRGRRAGETQDAADAAHADRTLP